MIYLAMGTFGRGGRISDRRLVPQRRHLQSRKACGMADEGKGWREGSMTAHQFQNGHSRGMDRWQSAEPVGRKRCVAKLWLWNRGPETRMELEETDLYFASFNIHKSSRGK